MSTVSSILSQKNSQVWEVTPDTTVYNALVIMSDRNVGALMVMDGDKLAGIISERDYTRKVILKDRASKQTLVKEIMVSDVFYVVPDQDLDSCLALMTEKRIRHLPVLDNGKLVGIISIGDLVKHIISDQKIRIEHLEQVISWGENY